MSLSLGSFTSAFAATTTIAQVATYGQSLSLGDQGCPALSTSQPYSNLQLSTDPTGSLVPLVENILNFDSSNPPCNPATDKQESPASGLANTITSLSSDQSQVVAVTRSGVGGTAYSGLKKGTTPYSNLLTAITTVSSDTRSLGDNYRFLGVMFTHGETDYQENNTSGTAYEADLVQLQSDLNNDIQAITGQTSTVIVFLDQMSSWGAINPSGNPCYPGDTSYSCATYNNGTLGDSELGVPIAQWEYFRDHPSTSCLIGPKYQYNYTSVTGDIGVHLTNAGYQQLGELQGKFIKKVALDGQQCLPLAPRSITLDGATVTVKFWVPSGSLTIDTTLVAQRANDGFYYHDDSSSTSISSVTVIASDTVAITLHQVPTGANPRIGYAYQATRFASSSGASIAGAPGGNLRDTDPTVGQYGDQLYDWAVAFYEPVGFSWSPYTSTTAGTLTMGGPAMLGGRCIAN